jgi:hypothetical protein
MIDLPRTITGLFEAVNAQDTDRVLTHFTPDAVVTDDGRAFRGHDEIRQWSDKDNVAAQVVLTPTGVNVEGNETVVTVSAAGSFPGSPLPFVFRIRPSDAAFTSISGLTVTFAG